MSECCIQGCQAIVYARGWCRVHYKRWWKTGNADSPVRHSLRSGTLAERLAFYSKPEGDCTVWTGNTSHGYGVLTYRGKRIAAHRASYELAFGPIPAGWHVCHRCDNRPCLNVAHLFLGTAADNVADMVSKQRHLFGERNPSAILKEADVRSIHRLRSKGETQLSIAERFGITREHVSNILRGKRWSHV